jgi:ubiquinone/menaquinone biosynthesis C-methylase UbiE
MVLQEKIFSNSYEIQPDIHSSSLEYAARFNGAVGAWMLEVQGKATLDLLKSLSADGGVPIRTVLDVGGGHAQLVPYLIKNGYHITVTGSDSSCKDRLIEYINKGEVAFLECSLQQLNIPAASFDAVICFRQICHVADWTKLMDDLCRISCRGVVFDYPTLRSVNYISKLLFKYKKSIEGNTRPFTVFSDRKIQETCEKLGWHVARDVRQFALPLALHRAFGNVRLSRNLEGFLSFAKVKELFGSPVVTLLVK